MIGGDNIIQSHRLAVGQSPQHASLGSRVLQRTKRIRAPGVAAERRDEIAVNHPGTEPETAAADVQPVVEMFTQERVPQ